jgi:hypothetical protein
MKTVPKVKLCKSKLHSHVLQMENLLKLRMLAAHYTEKELGTDEHASSWYFAQRVFMKWGISI